MDHDSDTKAEVWWILRPLIRPFFSLNEGLQLRPYQEIYKNINTFFQANEWKMESGKWEVRSGK